MMGTPDSFDPNRKSKRLTVDEILAGVGERIEPGASSGTSEVPDAEIEVPSQIEELNEWRKNEWQKIQYHKDNKTNPEELGFKTLVFWWRRAISPHLRPALVPSHNFSLLRKRG